MPNVIIAVDLAKDVFGAVPGRWTGNRFRRKRRVFHALRGEHRQVQLPAAACGKLGPATHAAARTA
jgi:hypothetical protein